MKAYKNKSNSSSNRLDINQLFVLLFHCVPESKHIMSNDNLLKNANILQAGTDKNRTTALTTKPQKHKSKNYKMSTCFLKLCNVENLDSFNPEMQLKNSEFAIKNKLENLWNELRGLKFVMILVLKFKNNK